MEPAGSPSAGTPSSSGAEPPPASGSPGALVLAIVLYVGARVLVVGVVTGVLVLVGLPLLLCLIVALIVALPVSLLFFRPLSARLNREMWAATAGRRLQRERLRAELRGDRRT